MIYCSLYGGSLSHSPLFSEVSFRGKCNINYYTYYIGFRLIKTLKP